MQIDSTQRAGIITAATVVGAGAGATIGHYMPMVNSKNVAISDTFVKEVAKEITGERTINLLQAASAKDHLDTLYPSTKSFPPNAEQVDKFFNRYGDFLEISRDSMKDEKGKPLKGNALRDKLRAVVDEKIAKSGAVVVSEDGKDFGLVVNTATNDEAKALIKKGFKDKKLVKAGEAISESGLDILKSAIKTVKNERMLKGGLAAGAVGLLASIVATCQRD